jgi:hypothetical protein
MPAAERLHFLRDSHALLLFRHPLAYFLLLLRALQQ